MKSFKIIAVLMFFLFGLVGCKPLVENDNKATVKNFYEGVFVDHEVAKYSDQYLGSEYIQHNPYLANGKNEFVAYFKQYFIENPKAKSSIKRLIAADDLVVVHAHSTKNDKDTGDAVIDIFRLDENHKIVEHWDVIQSIPEKSANDNTMF